MDHGINTKLSYKNFQLKYFQISITGSLDPPLSPPLSISTHTPLPSSFTYTPLPSLLLFLSSAKRLVQECNEL